MQRRDGRHTLPSASANRAASNFNSHSNEYALCSSMALAACPETARSDSHEQLAVTVPLAVDTQRHNCAVGLSKMPRDAIMPLLPHCSGAAADSAHFAHAARPGTGADPNVVYGCFQFDAIANAIPARAFGFGQYGYGSSTGPTSAFGSYSFDVVDSGCISNGSGCLRCGVPVSALCG